MSQGSLSRRGMLFVLSSPSGAGKTSLSRALLKSDDQIQLSISATTRPPRPGEVDGEHYYFMSKETFQDETQAGAFLEYAEVFGNYYGTPKGPVESLLNEGQDVLFDIDWQGTQQLAQQARTDLVSIFILPPSKQTLEERLRSRAQDSEEVVQHRMSKATSEMSHWAEYDYVVINNDFEEALHSLKAILLAERLKRTRQLGLTQFVRELCDKGEV